MKNAAGVVLTSGPIAPSLIRFALPFLGSSVVQQLYNTVDVMFVATLVGTNAAAAVGASSLIVTCMVGFFTGLSIGISILTAKAFARQDEGALRRIIHGSAALTLVLAIVVTIVGIALAPIFLRCLQTPEAIMAEALLYIRIYMVSLFSMVSYNIGAGILRAFGNSKSPLWYQAIGGIMNVLGNAFFIGVCGWGIAGSAITIVCSQTVAAGLVIYHLCHLRTDYALRVRCIACDMKVTKEVLRLGVPAAIQAMVITFSNLFVQSAINGLGIISIAAFTAYFKVENLIYLPIMAMGQACSVFASQHMGIGNLTRLHKGMKVAIALGVAITAVLTALVLAAREPIFSLFASEDAVISLGSNIALVTYPFYVLYMFLEGFGATLRGIGKTFAVMVIILVNMCVVRLALLHVFLWWQTTATGVAWVYPLTWGCTACSLGIYYGWWHWQHRSQVRTIAAEGDI